jgi:hypothetical protein
MNEADMAIPEGSSDHTVNAFLFPRAGGEGDASFVVTRDSETKSDTVEHYADQQLVDAAKRLGGYTLIERRAGRLGSQGSIQVDCTWVGPGEVLLRQRQAYVQLKSGFLIFTLTARANDFDRHEAAWRETIASVRLR